MWKSHSSTKDVFGNLQSFCYFLKVSQHIGKSLFLFIIFTKKINMFYIQPSITNVIHAALFKLKSNFSFLLNHNDLVLLLVWFFSV